MKRCSFRGTGPVPCLLLFLLPFLGQSAFAQQARSHEVGRPFITNYTPADYNASFQNWAIAQDDRGIMYFGNNSGVLEFDGASWRLIEVPNRTVVRSLIKGPDGRIWAGAVGDFGYLEQDSLGMMQFVSIVDKIPEADRDFADVWQMSVMGDEIFFNASSTIFRWDGNAMRVYPAGEASFHVGAVVDSVYYVRQWEVGLLRLEGDEFLLVPGGEQFAQVRVYVMLPFGDGRVLLGARDQGLFLLDETGIRPFATEIDEELRQSFLYVPGAVLPGGRFALGTFDGVYVIDRQGRLVEHISRESGLRDNIILYSFLDDDSALWLGLDNGLARVEIDSPFSYFAAADGLDSNVLSLERHKGALYVGASTGLYRLDGASRRFVEVKGAGTQVFDLLSVQGDLIAASFDGLFLIDGDQARAIRQVESGGGVSNRLHVSKQDSNVVFASSTGDGLVAIRRLGDGRWESEGRVPNTRIEIWSIAEPEPGVLWLGTTAGGVLRVEFPQTTGTLDLESAVVTRFGLDHGLPTTSAQVAATSRDLIFLTKDGLLRFDPESERFFPDSTSFRGVSMGGDPEEWVIQEAEDGRVWVSFGRETAVAIRQADGSYLAEAATFRRFAGRNAATLHPDADGTLWLSGMDRLIRVDLNALRDQAGVFPTLIRRVVTSDDRLLFGGTGAPSPLELPPSERAIRFEFAAPRYMEGGRTEYQVMLDGFDEHPSAWTREIAKEYTNLPPGSYTFRVRARDANGIEGTEAVYPFRILAPWYQTPWAFLLYLLAAGALVFGVVRARTHQLKMRSRELEQIVQDRTAELEQRVDELDMVNRISRALVAQLDFDPLVNLVGERMRELFQADVAYVATLDREAGMIHFPYVYGDNLKPMKLGAGLTSRIIQTGEPLLINEDVSGKYKQLGLDEVGSSVASYLGVPITVRNESIGVISVQSRTEKDRFGQDDLRLLTTIAANVGVALQNAEAYRNLAEAHRHLAEALDELKSTQAQLVHQEKLASLGALTAGIAHEIKNPLNFVNNFASLNRELVDELEAALGDDSSEVRAILADLRINGDKIEEHGRRADAIVRSMLDHSRGASGQRRSVDLNTLVDEYVGLAYHGKRAQSADFTVRLERDYDESVGEVTLVPQEIGRVIVNILGNAFDAVQEHHEQSSGDGDGQYTPTVRVQTRRIDGSCIIRVEDNGPGIPEDLRQRIFEPFFTTKPAGSGTGLGLSLSHEIVTQGHGGTLTVESDGRAGAAFVITLPVVHEATANADADADAVKE